MAIDFPNSPSVNDQFVSGGRTWIWDGSVWKAYTQALSNATVTTAILANNAVTYAKLAPTGAADGQALLANSATGSGLEWGQAGSPSDDGSAIIGTQVFS
jgi:hypothetical protein